MREHRGDSVMPRTPDETYDDVVRQAAPWLALGLAGVHGATSALNVSFLDGTARTITAAAALVAALIYVATWMVWRRLPLSPARAHPAAAAMVLLAVAVGVLQLVITADPAQSTHVVLAVAGSGAVLLSARWLAGTLYLTWGAWGAAAVLIGESEQWPRFVVAMTIATVVAAGVNALLRRVVRELADVRATAEATAVRDSLTGLSNRRGLAMVGAQVAEHARRTGDAVHCIFVDIVGLSAVNDDLGHEVGDDVLISVAEALRRVTRSTDVVARWGGDEFCVVGPGAGMSPVELERRVRDVMLLDPPVPVESWAPRVCAGGAMLEPWDSGSLDTLLGKADHEMFLRRALRREGPAPSTRRASAE